MSANNMRELIRRAFASGAARDAAELEKIEEEAEGGEGEGEHQHVHVHLPNEGGATAGTTDDPVEQVVTRMEALERQVEEMGADLQTLAEAEAEEVEGQGGGGEDYYDRRYEDRRRRYEEDARGRRADDSRGRLLDDARRRHLDRMRRSAEDRKRRMDDRRHDDRGRHDDARRHHEDACRHMEDARKRLDDARGRMDDARHRRLEADWRRMSDDLDRHRSDDFRRYDDDARRRMDDDRKRFDDAFNSEAAGEEANKPILAQLEFEAPPGTGDRARAARDSALFADAHQETVALAEILAPGIRIPTFNRNAKPTETVEAMFDLRRRALTTAYSSGPELRSTIDVLSPGGRFDAGNLNLEQLRLVFKGAALQRRAANVAGNHQGVRPPVINPGRPTTPAELQKQLDAHWSGGRIN